MRNFFAKSILKLKKKNSKLILLSGDIGNKLFDEFKKKYPKNFINCGIAEANMTTFAAGLAKKGFLPITYTIATFNTLKTIEQIKIDICYPKLPVIIIGTGSGISYAPLGATHHSIEDIGILRNLPNLDIYAPIDNKDLYNCLKIAIKKKRPSYIRIAKKENWNIDQYKFLKKTSKGIYKFKNFSQKRILIVSTGIITSNVFEAMKNFKNKIIKPDILPLSKIKEIDKNLLNMVFKSYEKIIIVEEHINSGGLFSTILEFASNNQINFKLKDIKSISLPNKFLKGLGSKNDALKSMKLDPKSIYESVNKYLR